MTPRTGSTSKAAKPAAKASSVKAAKPAPKAAAKPAPKPAPKAVAAKPALKPAPKALAKPAPPKPAPKPVAKPAPKFVAPPPAPKPAPTPRPAPVKPAPPVEKVSKKEHKHFENRLLEERGRLLKELGYLEANVLKQNQRDSSGDLSGYSFHMADLGTDAMEREKAFLFASAEGRAIYDVDEALRRLYNGDYGSCESCGQPIARERLEVVPHARLCIRCKEREEKAGRR
jgi:RNA polymerase-binding transcription factor